MSYCMVEEDASGCKSPAISAAATLSDVGVELVRTVNIVQATSCEPPEEVPVAATPSEAEYRDLGDAIASILSSPSSRQQLDDACSTDSDSPLSSLTSNDILSVSGEDPCSPASLVKTSAPSSDSEEDNSPSPREKKIIKLPQRKGGMQLWQFLYALLSDPQYKDMIEWTSNVKEREFRLHEPEAIAIWWGDHKNKRNMSYDKLSRSLRYYYDKGIIRKINGQRYVYRFCVAPEVMYRHIGNSDSRPKLKPMSITARNALSTANNYQNMPYLQPIPPYPHSLYNPHFVTYTSLSPHTNFLQMPSYLQPPPPPPPPLPVCTASPPSYDSTFNHPPPHSQSCYPEPPPSFPPPPPPHHFSPRQQLDQLQPPMLGEYQSHYHLEDTAVSATLLSCEGSPSPPSVSLVNHSPSSFPTSTATAQTSPISPLQYNWNHSHSL